jgi:hypothetical protein
MSILGHSFTLRYYELRTVFDLASVDVLSVKRYTQDESCVFVVYHSREPV